MNLNAELHLFEIYGKIRIGEYQGHLGGTSAMQYATEN